MKNSNLEIVSALILEMNKSYEKSGLKNPDRADRNKDKKISSWEKKVGAAIEKNVKNESHPRNEAVSGKLEVTVYNRAAKKIVSKTLVGANEDVSVVEVPSGNIVYNSEGMMEAAPVEQDPYGNRPKPKATKDKHPAGTPGMTESHEGQDHEVSMAQNSLKSIISSASQLMNMLGQDEKDIPAWIQDHITNAENYINQASKNYHEYHNGGEDMDELPVGNEEEPVDDMTLQSIAEAKFINLKDFSKNLKLYKNGDIDKSQLITSYNNLSAEDQDKAKELAKDLDVLPSPKKTNEPSLKSIMETVVKREVNEMIKKVGSKYNVYSKKGKKLGSHPSKKKAQKQMAAIEISKQGK